MNTFPHIGSISEGTLLTADLIATFSSELGSLTVGTQTDEHFKLIGDCDTWLEQAEEYDDADEPNDTFNADGQDLLAALEDALGELAAPYTYFGTSDGDGACFGFWPSIDSLEEDVRCGEVLKIDAGDEIPTDYFGYVMAVTDHGNVTLFCKSAAQTTEIWSCV